MDRSSATHYFMQAMQKRVSAAEANQDFFRLLRGAQAGETVVIALDGEAVARLGPAPHQGSAAAGRALLEP